MLLNIALIMQTPLHASMQEPAQSNSSRDASSDNKASQQATPDQKPDSNVAPKPTTNQPEQASGQQKATATGDAGKSENSKASATTVSAGNGKARHSKSNSETPQGKPAKAAGGQSPIQDAAGQIVRTLDAAMSRFGPESPAGVLPGALKDRRDKLQQEVQAAKDDAAWARVANDAARLLNDTVNLMPAKVGDQGAGAEKSNGAAGGASAAMNQSTASQSDDERSFESRRLPLYLASLALALSIIGLAAGWLLARRAINKALTEAGLV